MGERGGNPWLVLMHQVPAKPDHLRVKVWRRLQRIGAATLKNSVWVLPRTDAAEGDFTHRGDRCTFEVLAGDFAPHDAAQARLGEIVHDVDFKDGKYGVPETAGFARVIEGICSRLRSDVDRIEHGAALLDDLYAAFAEA